MKHKRFDEIFAYTYWIKCKNTGRKYHGVRYANIKLALTPIEDFANVYFTSGKLKEDFERCSADFEYKLCLTFDSLEEALEYESMVNTKLMYRKDWEVWNNSKAIVNKISPSLGRKVRGTIIADRISKGNTGKTRSHKLRERNSLKQKEMVEAGIHYWQSEKHSESTSKRMTENNPSKNGLSEEHKRKIGDSQRGVTKGPQTKQHRLNNSLSHKGQVPWNKGLVLGSSEKSRESGKRSGETRRGKKRGKYKPYTKSPPSYIVKASCVCCRREWDLGNLAKHLRKQNELPV